MRVRRVSINFSNLRPGGVRTLNFYWARGLVDDAVTLGKFALGGPFVTARYLGGQGSHFEHDVDDPVGDRRIIAVEVFSINPVTQSAFWEVYGHGPTDL